MNTTIDISRFIGEDEDIVKKLYEDTGNIINIGGLHDLLNLPTNPNYKKDNSRFLGFDVNGIKIIAEDGLNVTDDSIQIAGTAMVPADAIEIVGEVVTLGKDVVKTEEDITNEIKTRV